MTQYIKNNLKNNSLKYNVLFCDIETIVIECVHYPFAAGFTSKRRLRCDISFADNREDIINGVVIYKMFESIF